MKKPESWFRPYVLNRHNIEKVVSPKKPGVYVLAHLGPNRKLQIKHIKSSGNVKKALLAYLGKYPIFLYRPFKHQLNAFRQQQTLGFAA